MRNASFRLQLQQSRVLHFVILLAHVVGAYATLTANIIPLVQGILLLCIGASLALHLRPRGELVMEFRADGTAQLVSDESSPPVGAGDTPSKQTRASIPPPPHALVDGTRSLGPMLFICFPSDWGLRPMILWRDSFTSPDDFRRLRVWLKWSDSSGVSPHASRLGSGR